MFSWNCFSTIFIVLFSLCAVADREIKGVWSEKDIEEEYSIDKINREENTKMIERRSDKKSITRIDVDRGIEEDGNIYRKMKVVRRNFKDKSNEYDTPFTEDWRNIKLKVNSKIKKKKLKSPDQKVNRKNRQIYRGDYIKHIKQRGRPEQDKSIRINEGYYQLSLESVLQPHIQPNMINDKESHQQNMYIKPTNHPTHATHALYLTGQSLPYHPTTPLPQFGPIHGYNYATRHSYVHVQFGKASSYPFSKLISTEEHDGGLIKQQSIKNDDNNVVFPTSHIKKIQETNNQQSNGTKLYRPANTEQGTEYKKIDDSIVKNPAIDLLRNTNKVRFEIEEQRNLKVRFDESEKVKMLGNEKVIFPRA